MKKTSRRRFGKQLAGAIAAIPVVSSFAEAEGQGRNKADIQTKQARIFREHDTPPPVLFMQGSFIIETAELDFDESGVTMGSRKKYRRHPHEPMKTKVHLAHIKIIDGSGEILYRNDNIMDDPSHPPIDLRLAVTTQSGVVNIASVANNFEIDTPGNKKLDKVDKVTHPDDQPMGTKRHARFRYKDASSGSEESITGIRVTKGGSTVLFENSDLSDLASKGEELKIMVWLEET